jgi:protein phosphatase
LITIANTENGHDNATIALLHVRLRRKPDAPAIAFPEILESIAEPDPVDAVSHDIPKTEASPPPRRRSNQWLLVLVGLLGVTGIGLLSWEMWRRSQVDSSVVIDPPPAVEAVPIPEAPLDKPPIIIPGDAPSDEAPSPLTKNQILQLQADTTITAFYTPQAIADPAAPTITIPGGSILRIEQINADDQILLEVCQLPAAPTSPAQTGKILAKGNRGWSSQATVKEKLDPSFVVGTETICGSDTEEVTPPSATPPGAG